MKSDDSYSQSDSPDAASTTTSVPSRLCPACSAKIERDHHGYWCPKCKRLWPIGMSISSAVDSHARTSACQENARESAVSVAACGRSSFESFAYYDRSSSSWRTYQRSLFQTPETNQPQYQEFLETWPRAGSMLNGTVSRRQPLVPITKGIGSSLWPTPRASMGDHMICWKRAESGEHRCNLEDFLAWLWLKEGNVRTRGFDVNPDWLDWYAGFPVRWTDLKETATASGLDSQNGSDEES